MDILSDVKINGSLVVDGKFKPTGGVYMNDHGNIFFGYDGSGSPSHYLYFQNDRIQQCGSYVNGSYPYFRTYKIQTTKIEDQDKHFLIDFCEDKKSVILSSCYGPSVNLSNVSEKQIYGITVPTNCTGFYIGKTTSFPIVMGFRIDGDGILKKVEMDYCVNGQIANGSNATEFLIYAQIPNGLGEQKDFLFSFM